MGEKKEKNQATDAAKFTAKVKRLTKNLKQVMEAYEQANPEWVISTGFEIIHNAFFSLRSYIENPKEKAVTWAHPGVMLHYSVNVDWEKIGPLDTKKDGAITLPALSIVYQNIIPEDLKDPETWGQKLADVFLTYKELYVLRLLCQDIVCIQVLGKEQKTELIPLLSEEMAKDIKKLPQEQQDRAMSKILEAIKWPSVEVTGKLGDNKPFKVTALLQFFPLTIDPKNRRAYYPIFVALDAEATHLEKWSGQDRDQFWKILLGGIKGAAPKERLDFFSERPPVPERLPFLLVRTALHATAQQIGNLPDPRQESLFALVDMDRDKGRTSEYTTKVVGLNLSPGKKRAFFAVQKLLDKTNYKGNIGQGFEIETSTGGKIVEPLPLLRITHPHYFEAYGLRRRKSKRGKMEFDWREAKNALQDLEELSKTQAILVWERKHWPKREKDKGASKPEIDRIELNEPIIKILKGWKGLTEEETRLLDAGQANPKTKGKQRFTVIRPSPVMVDQINTYFGLKHSEYLDEIKQKVPHASSYVYHLVDWLIYEAEQKRRHRQTLTIEIGRKALAHKLWMQKLIDNRHWGQIIAKQDACLKDVRDKLGYLLKWETVSGHETARPPGKIKVYLNPERYVGLKQAAIGTDPLTPEEKELVAEVDEWLNRKNERGQNEHGTKKPYSRRRIEILVRTHGAQPIRQIYQETALGGTSNVVEFYKKVKTLKAGEKPEPPKKPPQEHTEESTPETLEKDMASDKTVEKHLKELKGKGII